MTNKEAIERLKVLTDYEYNEDLEALELAIKTLEGRPTGKWIPVSERLPEKMGSYLVTLEYKEHGTGVTTLWYHGEGIGWDLRVADVVIAWMPLPQPYKEAE